LLEQIRGLGARVRDEFSSSVLATTSPEIPNRLAGGLSFGRRLTISTLAITAGTLLAFLMRGPVGDSAALFFFPAIMMTALFGGLEFGVPALVITTAISGIYFTHGDATLAFGAAASMQVLVASVLRQFFSESRRWGVRYRKLVSAISSATSLSDADGSVERPQPELGRLIGMEWPTYRGTRWLEAVHPEDHALLPPASSLSDNSLYRAEVRLKDPLTNEWRWHLIRATPLLDDSGDVAEWISILTDIHPRKLAEQRKELLLGELRHRLKNLMTVIQAVAKSSQPHGDQAVDLYLQKFFGRLHALEAAGDQVIVQNRTMIETGGLVRATLAPFMSENPQRVAIAGPRCMMSEATGGALAMGIHELATNAIKYGSLSVPKGTVSVVWECRDTPDGERVVIDWTERGGPVPLKPNREGYGSRLIRFIPARERSSKVDIDYAPEGLHCRISFVHDKLMMVPQDE
jgi:two-component sensor histidine kinase/PAS domain-containing protein